MHRVQLDFEYDSGCFTEPFLARGDNTVNGLDFLLDPPAQRFSDWSWATVTSVDPVHIRLDGDTAPLAVPPTLLVPEAELEVDTRVRVHMDKSNALGQVGARIYVIGVAGGGGAAITGSCKHLRTGVNAACSGNGYR